MAILSTQYRLLWHLGYYVADLVYRRAKFMHIARIFYFLISFKFIFLLPDKKIEYSISMFKQCDI